MAAPPPWRGRRAPRGSSPPAPPAPRPGDRAEARTGAGTRRAGRCPRRARSSPLLQSRSALAERHQREVVPIHPVAKVEMARESGAGELVLVPATVGALGGEEMVDALDDGVADVVRSREQAEQRPCRLRRRGAAVTCERFVVVGAERLAPATVCVLLGLEPRDRAEHVWRVEPLA